MDNGRRSDLVIVFRRRRACALQLAERAIFRIWELNTLINQTFVDRMKMYATRESILSPLSRGANSIFLGEQNPKKR